jgi:single-stranded DNA-binding protein
MKPSMNKFMGMGTAHNLKKIETTSGKSMVAFNLRIYKKVNEKDIVTFINCNAYSGLADVLDKNLKDGESVFVEGYLHVYKDKEANERFSLVVDEFRFLGGKNEVA